MKYTVISAATGRQVKTFFHMQRKNKILVENTCIDKQYLDQSRTFFPSLSARFFYDFLTAHASREFSARDFNDLFLFSCKVKY